jgi:peptide/nickel transport system substrate-binding protein
MVEEEFPVGARRLVGGILEINYGEPKYGGRLQLQAVLSLNSWDPFDPGLGCFPQGCPHAFSSLLQFNPWTFDRFDIWGDLAEDWRQVDAEGKVWEFNLNPRAVWWDGTPITAQDVVYSFDRMSGLTPDKPGGAGREASNYIVPRYDFSEAVDANTFRMHLLAPWADFLAYMANDLIYVIPEAHYRALDIQAAAGEHDYSDFKNTFDSFMGSGPFITTNVVENTEWHMDKNPIYWKVDPDGRDLPYMDGADFFEIRDRTAAQAAWESENVWLSGMNNNGNMAPGAMKELTERSAGRFLSYPTPCCPAGFAFNTTKPPWDDVRVRLAFSLALDRQEMNDLVWSGLGVLGTVCGPPGHPLCRTADEVLALPGWRQPKDQDVAEARRLMAEVGLSEGFETTLITRNFLNEQDIPPVITPMMRDALSIDIDGQTVDGATWGKIMADGSFDIMTHISGAGVVTPSQYFQRFFQLDQPNNPFSWTHPCGCLVQLIADQDAAVDPAARKAIIREIDDLLLADTWYVMDFIHTFARFFNVEKMAGLMPMQSGYVENRLENLWALNP